MAKRKEDRADELIDELLAGKRGLLKELTKPMVERALQGEMTEHLGRRTWPRAGTPGAERHDGADGPDGPRPAGDRGPPGTAPARSGHSL